MSSSSSPCAACKFLQLNCTQECVFAPYFPADQLRRFSNVDRLFGASNVAKVLNMLSPENRKYLANSLAYEADMCIDPDLAKLLTYEADKGCSGKILVLQQENRQIRHLLKVMRDADAATVRIADAALAAYRATADAGDAALAAYRATADAADASNGAAGVSLGHNVFTPPRLDHHPRQQQQAYNYLAPGQATSGLQIGNGDDAVCGSEADEPSLLAERERDLPEQK